MQKFVCACLVALAAACTAGAPPGFSGGDHWTLPLVGPLEDGLLITPVSIQGHGPYLFAIDPDASVSGIDEAVVREAGLWTGYGPHWIDETDTGRPRSYAELLDLRVGGLIIDRRDAMVFASGTFDTEGRHISGILGRDVLADSLVFGFDREQGIATLSTVQAFVPPPGAVAIRYQSVQTRSAGGPHGAPADSRHNLPGGSSRVDRGRLRIVGPVPRRLAIAQIGAAAFAMHLDLGATVSQLPVKRWQEAGLAPVAASLRLVDEAGSPREVSRAAVGAVRLGRVQAEAVRFVPYIEQRFKTEGVAGALGLDFFRSYAVYASWHDRTYYLSPRGDAARAVTARLGRWGAELLACPHAGCVTAEVVERGGGLALRVVRDPEAAGRPLEVLLGVTPAPGKAAAPLVVSLTASAGDLETSLATDYAGAQLAVLDASPFPRACPGKAGCVVPLAGRLLHAPEPANLAAHAVPAAVRAGSATPH